jgi:predicted RNA methylase
VRRPSARYWTQVGVAIRVVRWLAEVSARSVLDVGAGAGKFCVVGALGSRMTFTGVEQRASLVEAARELAYEFDVEDRATFIQGDMEMADFSRFDALYFYNPFGENLFPPSDHLDEAVEVSRARFKRDIAKAEHLIGRMPVGSYLVTYNGFGGRVPDSFDLVKAKTAGINMLRLWRKAREHDAGGYLLELEELTLRRAPGQPEMKAEELVDQGSDDEV